VKFEDLHNLTARLEADADLLAPAGLRGRIEALDELDAHLGGDLDKGFKPPSADSALLNRVADLRRKLEVANAAVYGAIREEIRQGNTDGLRNWFTVCRDAPDDPVPGLGYDYLDELIAEVLRIPEPGNEMIEPGLEHVFYQPTPVRHTLAMIERSGLSAKDVLIDFGSGLGQLCIVTSFLTGARAIGVEVEATYVKSARECARNLGLDRVTFLHADAREVDLTSGTVFHLYTPFTGSILRTVLDRLRQESLKRPITICTLGPCADIVAMEPWLVGDAMPDANRVTVFRS